MDVIRPITPKGFEWSSFHLRGHQLLYQVGRSRRYDSVAKLVVARFIKREIICWYGLPERIISDNGLNLNNDMVTEVCTRFKIKHHNSIPYRSKMNDAVKAANKNVKKDYSQGYRDIQRLAQEVAFCTPFLSNWGLDIDWSNSIFTSLWNGGCFAYRSVNFVSTSTQRSRVRKSWMG